MEHIFHKAGLQVHTSGQSSRFDNTLETKLDSTFAGFGILQCVSQNAVWNTLLWNLSARSISDMVSGWTQLKACGMNERRKTGRAGEKAGTGCGAHNPRIHKTDLLEIS